MWTQRLPWKYLPRLLPLLLPFEPSEFSHSVPAISASVAGSETADGTDARPTPAPIRSGAEIQPSWRLKVINYVRASFFPQAVLRSSSFKSTSGQNWRPQFASIRSAILHVRFGRYPLGSSRFDLAIHSKSLRLAYLLWNRFWSTKKNAPP